MEDLKNHSSTFETPISTSYRDEYELFEVSPNGQGITTLIALNLLEGIDVGRYSSFLQRLPHSSFEHAKSGAMDHGSAEHLHTLIEFMRLAFADTRHYVADPSKTKVPVEGLLSKDYANKRRKLFDPARASVDVAKGSPPSSSDTVSFRKCREFEAQN